MPDTVGPFGSTVDGVRSLLVHRRIEATTKPSEEDVGRYLDAIGGRVRARVGNITVESDPDHYGMLAGLVELGAGAMTEDAAFPERGGRAQSSYGTVLWERFNDGLDELAEELGRDGEGGGTPTTDVPDYNFPETVLFARDQGY